MKIVSGGQTGVDRAALDVAEEFGLERGGWCPRGRLAEDGPLETSYPLQETPGAHYAQRTEWNVRDSDATLILAMARLSGGTALTVRLARQRGRPVKVVDPTVVDEVEATLEWLAFEGVRTLNVAGPRESTTVGVYEQAAAFLRRLFSALAERAPR